MSFDHLRTAAVVEFPYLWSREAQKGETEGREKRPVVVAERLARPNGEDAVLLLPITTRPPRPGQPSAEIPEMERRRAGLHADARLWIILPGARTCAWPFQQSFLPAVAEGVRGSP